MVHPAGSGPLRKSSGNAENVRPDSSPLNSDGGNGGTHNIVSGTSNVTARTRKAGHFESTLGSSRKPIHPAMADERASFKPRSGANGWNTRLGKENQAKESRGSTKQHKAVMMPAQDRGQGMLVKRSHRSNADSLSGSQRDRSYPSQPQSHTTGNYDHRPGSYRRTQPATGERNGAIRQNRSHHNPSASNGAESWNRDHEQRKSPAERGYKDQRPQRMMENSSSERHLESFSSFPVTDPPGEVERKKFAEPTHVPADWGRLNSDSKEGLSHL